MIKYFISFADINGFGNTVLELDKEIKDFTDIKTITDYIEKNLEKNCSDSGMNSVAILNIQKMPI